MPYISINNFKFGLDGRRSELSSMPGALIDATDGHITQGGEFEKRLGFILMNGVNRPANTFGLEVNQFGLVTFGTASPSGSSYGYGTLYNINGYPGLLYCWIRHQSANQGNANPPTIVSVICSTSFGGQELAIIKFSDGSILGYLNGTAIPSFYTGLILIGATGNQALATALRAVVINQTGFYAGAVTVSGSDYYFDMWSDAGLDYSITASQFTAAGTLAVNNISSYIAGTVATAAATTFSIIGGSNAGSGKITSIQVYNGSTWTEILGVAVAFGLTNTTGDFAALVAAQIATYGNSIAVSALATNNTISLSFPSSLGTTPNGYALKVTASGDCCTDNTVFDFSQNATISAANCTSILVPNQTNLATGLFYSGGTYTLTTLTNGKYYYWAPGANDTSLVNGTQTLTEAGLFQFNTGTNPILHGTGSLAVTATLLTCVEVLGATVTSGTDVTAWVAAIAAQVQTYCVANSLNYTAFANSQQLVVSRLVADGSLPFGVLAGITVSSGVIVVNGAGTPTKVSNLLAVTLSPNPVSTPIPSNTSSSSVSSTLITASVTGGTPPYYFSWSQSEAFTPNGIGGLAIPTNALSANEVTLTVRINAGSLSGGGGYLGTHGTIFAQFICTVTDSNNLSAFGTLNVQIPY